MKFNLKIAGEQSSEAADVEFSLRKNGDGSIGLVLKNSALNNQISEVLVIGADGIITLRAHYNNPNPKAFFRYEEELGNLYVRTRKEEY